MCSSTCSPLSASDVYWSLAVACVDSLPETTTGTGASSSVSMCQVSVRPLKHLFRNARLPKAVGKQLEHRNIRDRQPASQRRNGAAGLYPPQDSGFADRSVRIG